MTELTCHLKLHTASRIAGHDATNGQSKNACIACLPKFEIVSNFLLDICTRESAPRKPFSQ